jgi:hypothetical protein
LADVLKQKLNASIVWRSFFCSAKMLHLE